MIVTPMATTGTDPVGSMGNDAPLAVLSEKPQLLYSYFKQLFAQVTNPPVDAIREEIIMATDRAIGPEENLLEPGPNAAHQVAIPSPVISNSELEQIRALDGASARVPDDHAADPVQGLRQRGGAPARDRGPPARGVGGDQRGLQPDHPVGPRPQDRRADPRCSR